VAKNHSDVYRKRNDLAKREGYKSYGQKRAAMKFAKSSPMFEENVDVDELSNREVSEAARDYYDAFKLNPTDYSANGGKKRWFVDQMGIMTSDEWKERYPNGRREYVPARFAA
jgi:hypothetical protein